MDYLHVRKTIPLKLACKLTSNVRFPRHGSYENGFLQIHSALASAILHDLNIPNAVNCFASLASATRSKIGPSDQSTTYHSTW